jgi:hypothetical protein
VRFRANQGGGAWTLVEDSAGFTASAASAILFDSALATDAKNLPSATGSGAVLFYANKSVQANPATLAPFAGQRINDLAVNAVFTVSNYSDGTQFIATDVAPGKWVVAVAGDPVSEALARYSVCGVADSINLVNGANILPIGSLVSGDLESSGQLLANEHDPLSWRIGNEITVSKSGRYRVDLNVVHTADPIVGPNAQASSGTSVAGIRINGTSIEWIGKDDSAGLADQMSGFIYRQFAAGDEIVVVVNATSAQTAEDFYVSFSMEESPSTETVPAGNVPVTSLHHGALSNDVNFTPTVGAAIVFASQVGTLKGVTLNAAAGTITIAQPGDYEVDGFAYAKNSNGSNAIGVYVNGAIAIQGPTVNPTTVPADHQILASGVLSLLAGDVVTLRATSVTSTAWDGPQLSVRQRPSSSVINPGATPVITDATLATGSDSNVASALAVKTYADKSAQIKINNNNQRVEGLYQVAIVRFTGNFEFFQDQYFRFDHNASAFRIAAVGTSRAVGVYGFNSGSNAGTFPVSTDTDFIGVGGYGSIAVGVFTTISNAGISNDYDDIQTFWIMTASAPVKYRVTLIGGFEIGAIVERWDLTTIPANTKITFPN